MKQESSWSYGSCLFVLAFQKEEITEGGLFLAPVIASLEFLSSIDSETALKRGLTSPNLIKFSTSSTVRFGLFDVSFGEMRKENSDQLFFDVRVYAGRQQSKH